MSTSTHLIPLPRLTEAMHLVVRGFGSSAAEVEAVAGNLIEANLTGHDSHGIGMLPRYAKSYLEGGLKPNTHLSVVHDGGGLLRLDGNAGFGQVIGAEAMALGIERTRQQGSCIVALGNAHHLGRIGAWAEQVAAAGLVSLHFVNVISRAIVAPHGGSDARFGTNPFCAGVPLPGRPPVILDFATSVIAQGKTRVAHNKGEAVEPGQLIDDQGQPTTNPRYTVIPPFGALLTFGGHKGYGLALMCELHDAARRRQQQDACAQRHVQRAAGSGRARRHRRLRARGTGFCRLGAGEPAAPRLRPRAGGRRRRACDARAAQRRRCARRSHHLAGDPRRGACARRRPRRRQSRCGSTNVKRLPAPGAEAISSRPP
jgi:LDH2 family malate/lactate/ureidoglycolate dehydrogenase